MRLIDADVLKTDLTRFYDGIVTAKQLIDEQPTIVAEPKGKDTNVPTIEAEPVRRGKWKMTDAYPHDVYCSVAIRLLLNRIGKYGKTAVCREIFVRTAARRWRIVYEFNSSDSASRNNRDAYRINYRIYHRERTVKAIW